jgi:hypothetical protein
MSTPDDSIPARNAGSDLVDYSLKPSNRKLILERRKVALLADRTGTYSSLTNDSINFTIAPGANDEWLDGRSSYITALLQVTSGGAPLNVTGSGASQFAYLPNGPAACFQQVQIISASGQQLVNIMDYHTIEALFTEWTSSRSWKAGIGQMYGTGDDEWDQWEPARYATTTTNAPIGSTGAAMGYNPAPSSFAAGAYTPFTTNIAKATYSGAGSELLGAAVVEQKPAGSSLALQASLGTSLGMRVAFRLNLAWIFGCPTLIPSQYFPLTLRCTLVNPAQSLSYPGIDSAQNAVDFNGNAAAWNQSLAPNVTGCYGVGPTSTAPAPAIAGFTAVVPGITKSAALQAPGSPVDLLFGQVKFMASLCKLSPKFKAEVDGEMQKSTFSMTITNYYTALNTITGNNVNPVINTTFSAHNCEAYYVKMIPQVAENNLLANFGYNWGAQQWQAGATSQLLLNGRYWPPQPNTNIVDTYHDTLDAFNTQAHNVAFSPVSFYKYGVWGKSFCLGFLLDRDAGSSLTGVSSVSSPVWTLQINNMPYTGALSWPYSVNVHTCIAYTQNLQIQSDGQIKIFQ